MSFVGECDVWKSTKANGDAYQCIMFKRKTFQVHRDARTSHPGEIVFNAMRHKSSETVQRWGYFRSSVSYIKVQIIFKPRK